MIKNKAIFLDRDGVINDLVYYPEEGLLDSPNSAKQFSLIPRVIESLKIFKKLGYFLILISNQPGIAKEKYTYDEFLRIKNKMESLLNASDVNFDDQFYCLHHPQSKINNYKLKCDCRKPNTKLVLDAIEKFELDIKNCFYVGDGLVDLQLAKSLNCKSVYIGNLNSTISNLFLGKNLTPNFIAHDLFEAAQFIESKTKLS